MKYFEFEVPEGDGICANNECLCKRSQIPRSTGYLYISKEAVQFRRDCLTLEKFHKKMNHIIYNSGAIIFVIPQHETGAVLICKQSAKLIGIDLKTAAADAKYWWETGKVPLRPTPSSIVSIKKWWQFWK